jgi:hypothetical protein
MKLLKIENSQGYYLLDEGEYAPVDKITKDDLLRLVNLTLESEVDIDEFNDEKLKNQAHQIIYKSIYEKLSGLKERRDEFKDESDRLYLQEYEMYRGESS